MNNQMELKSGWTNNWLAKYINTTGWSKSLYAPDDYSIKNMQKYVKQFQSITMIP
jgi:hypothetical protein